ncbi:Fe-S cluster assembly protein SufD [Thermoactinomyces mirandus]|uniref:Fe-S cluster assembly protein SufD n=1 Tax=Thermoactinomyces mirandus TaxID=2756294 RepID=A0A7W1XQY8_9BACL|nr:Fe-S cluster assembly protein SufD [Thermoactinomyces mirandus]MBA4601562.1 Fe-S cluster assembly protein SufD [Thermoactinomyces mirandus]
MSMDTQMLFDKKIVIEVSGKNGEADWMLQNRLDALKLAAQLPLPRLQKTNISKWNFTKFEPFAEEVPIMSPDELPADLREFVFVEDKRNLLVQKNASVIYCNLDQSLSEQGVIFTDLGTASQKHESLLRKYFMTDGVRIDEHRLTAIHAAFQSGGVFLYVPGNVQVKIPLEGLFWLSGKGAAMFPHILIVAEAGSRLDFVANFVACRDDLGAINNSVMEVFVGAQADVRISTVNNLNSEAVDVVYRRALVDRNGHLEWNIADLSDGRIVSNNTSHLQGESSNVDVREFALGTGDMKANVTSSVYHLERHTKSNINARSVMKDQASGIINSITKIEKGASKSDGQQSGKVLMLNPEARGDVNPILLIDENDVMAGHAASVGKVDPLQLYYLMSRGIHRSEAEKLIIHGFLDAIISKIPSNALCERIHHIIERKFKS